MPYIVQDKRNLLDPGIDQILDGLRQIESDDPENNFEGCINYIITALITRAYEKTSYREINDIIGALECAKLEFYRRQAAPYENQKCYENSDVYNTNSQPTIRHFNPDGTLERVDVSSDKNPQTIDIHHSLPSTELDN